MALPVLATAALATAGVLVLSKYRMGQVTPAPPQSGNADAPAVTGATGGEVDRGYSAGATFAPAESDSHPAVTEYSGHPQTGLEIANTGVDPSISPNAQPSALAVGTVDAVSAADATPPPVKVQSVQLKYGIDRTQLNGLPAYAQARAISEFGAANGEIW